MSGILNCDLDSDSSDEDYNPEHDPRANDPGSRSCSSDDDGNDEPAVSSIKDKSVSSSKQKSLSNGSKKSSATIDDLWSDFKKDTSTSKSSIAPTAKDRQNFTAVSVFDEIEKETEMEKPVAVENRECCTNDSETTVKKIFDYAGQKVEVNVDGAKDKSGPGKRSGGLSSVMDAIAKSKAPKMSCMDKTKHDWSNFVTGNSLKEELASHNQGKEGYVEKLQFLDRTDGRRFEIERDARDKSRKSLYK